ncbi:hypothetical protein [Xylella fastidiosa]|uniref:hypothetical protein n=1 Tax=Xylella fastidiosa TaxID=2371 RepID=UPI00076619A6|nr:hypothetical protein [Xylella fastidiosa]ALR01579.1 hypothetical protein OY18_04245 [Xylella fastidiosa]KXB13474.1 hypothetical protein ADT29_07940 [Xylella fastidiosa]KXB21327.1 hypothetical protein ADT28_05415 [Xylella fastidiosa]MDG5822445.1 hypothetical protein [Xylella fastidiosa subsp. pauca]MDG5825933.1 hypothetical protein [Xylella fastidiosa subsp. pauca]
MSTLTEEAQANQALSGTQKAPLFCRHGIRDEEDSELQEVIYFKSLDFTYPDPEGRCTVAIIEPLSGKFSPLVCSWFENGPQSDIKKWIIRLSDVERRINVGPEHSLYPQVKVAYEAQEAYSNFIFAAAAKKPKRYIGGAEAYNNSAPHQFATATPKAGES